MPLALHIQKLLRHALEELRQGQIDTDDFRNRLLENGFPHSDINHMLELEGWIDD